MPSTPRLALTRSTATGALDVQVVLGGYSSRRKKIADSDYGGLTGLSSLS